jgi:hypothetical protein
MLAFVTASTIDSSWGAKEPAEGIALARGDVKLALEAMAVWVADQRTLSEQFRLSDLTKLRILLSDML